VTETKLKVGDVVRLRGGGPTLTVISIDDPIERARGLVRVAWIAADGMPMGQAYPPEALELSRVPRLRWEVA
jgi:uncharacterized protein YodC (DUF2158 family)